MASTHWKHVATETIEAKMTSIMSQSDPYMEIVRTTTLDVPFSGPKLDVQK